MKKIVLSLGVIVFIFAMNINFTPKADKSIISSIDFSIEQAKAEEQENSLDGVFCVIDPFGWGISHSIKCSTCSAVDWFWLWCTDSRCMHN